MKLSSLTVLLIVLLLSAKSYSQGNGAIPVDEETKKITYKDVVQQAGEPAKLYNQAITWINANYKNADNATRVRDAINNKIEVRHRIKVYNIDKNGVKSDAGIIDYTLKLEFKQDKYRYIFTDFNVERTSKFPLERWLDKNDPQYTVACDSYMEQLNQAVLDLIKSLKEGMIIKVIKEDNW